jgi:hypothetical protein
MIHVEDKSVTRFFFLGYYPINPITLILEPIIIIRFDFSLSRVWFKKWNRGLSGLYQMVALVPQGLQI